MPPEGERSVCGMSGRHNAAVPPIFVENLRIPHGDSSAPRMVVSGLTQCKPQASHKKRNKISRGRRSAREGRGAAKSPRAPTASAIGDFVAGFSLIQAQARQAAGDPGRKRREDWEMAGAAGLGEGGHTSNPKINKNCGSNSRCRAGSPCRGSLRAASVLKKKAAPAVIVA